MDEWIELGIVALVSALVVGFVLFMLSSAPHVYDIRDVPAKDIGITYE